MNAEILFILQTRHAVLKSRKNAYMFCLLSHKLTFGTNIMQSRFKFVASPGANENKYNETACPPRNGESVSRGHEL